MNLVQEQFVRPLRIFGHTTGASVSRSLFRTASQTRSQPQPQHPFFSFLTLYKLYTSKVASLLSRFARWHRFFDFDASVATTATLTDKLLHHGHL